MIRTILNFLRFWRVIEDDEPVMCANPECRSLHWSSRSVHARGMEFCSYSCANIHQMHNSL